MKKVKLPTINKKNFPYDLVQVIWEDIVGDAGWAEIPDIKSASTAICCSLGSCDTDAVPSRPLP